MRQRALWIVLTLVCAAAARASAQVPVTVALDSVFYGDNNEFFSLFRTGETILGTWQTLTANIEMSEGAAFKAGVYLQERDGDESTFRTAMPVVSLTIGSRRRRFIMGTLETMGDRPGMGPDQTTPHGLLPPLAVETLWFTRAYEAGLQWRMNTERSVQDIWFDYRKMITPDHRELFDGGIIGRLQRSASSPVALVYQFHVVHHGGQQFKIGGVSDSYGFAPGLLLRHRVGPIGVLSLEGYAMHSIDDRPDREVPGSRVTGRAGFFRAAAERNDWRGHVIFWRGDTFKHEEGDLNYLSELPNGTNYPAARHYVEAGLTRLIRPTPGLDFEVSVRGHRVQGINSYSYRLMGRLHLDLLHLHTH